jgi:hypothetical protein
MTASLHRSFALMLALLTPLGAFAQEPTGDGEQPEAAPKAEGQAGLDLFPLEQGYRWSFQVKWSIEPKSTGEQALPPEESVQSLEVYVAPPQAVGGAPTSVVEWKLDGDLSQRCYFVVRGRSVLCVKRIQGFGEHMKEFNLDPGQPVVRDALKVGDTWTWEGKINGVDSQQTFSVLREEELQTPAGTFPTIVIQVEYTGEDDSRGWTRRWLAPGIGIVKDESEVETPDSVFRTEGILVRYETP